MKRILDIFITDAPMLLRSLDAAIQSGNVKQLHRVAHTIKGSSSNVGAEQLHETTRIREEASFNNDLIRSDFMTRNIQDAFKTFRDTMSTNQGESI